jgi:hypothetical protein
VTTEQIIAVVTFSCGGLFFLLCGAGLLIPVLLSRHFRRTAATTVGVVVGYDTEERTEGGPRFNPVVKYQDGAGAEHTVTVRGTGQKPFEPGEQVGVLYHPDSPGRAEIAGADAYRQMAVWSCLMAVAGAAALLMGLAIWVFQIPVKRA